MNRRSVILTVKVLLTLSLLTLLFFKMDFSRFPEILSSIDLGLLFITFFMLFLNTTFSAIKWQMLLKSDGVDLPLSFLIKSYWVGSFMNLFLPTNVGGDVFRVRDVAKKSQNTAKSLASVFMERATGLFALSLIGCVACGLGYSSIHQKLLEILFLFFGLVIAIFLLLFHPLAQKCLLALIRVLPISKLHRLSEEFILSLNTYKTSKRTLFSIFSLSFLFQANVAFIVYLYAIALNYNIGPLSFFMFIPIITLIESLPLTPFSLGTRDWGYVFFFTKEGLSSEQAELLAITYVLMTILYTLPGGLIFVLRKRS